MGDVPRCFDTGVLQLGLLRCDLILVEGPHHHYDELGAGQRLGRGEVTLPGAVHHAVSSGGLDVRVGPVGVRHIIEFLVGGICGKGEHSQHHGYREQHSSHFLLHSVVLLEGLSI